MAETPRDDRMIAALKRERAGYVARGLDERVAQVDAQLELRGYSTEAAESKDTEPRSDPPKQRQAPPRRTAKGGKGQAGT